MTAPTCEQLREAIDGPAILAELGALAELLDSEIDS